MKKSKKPQYKLLEEEFSEYIGTKYGVAVNTGTAALHLSLAAMGIGAGDEVLVPEFTFISTAWAVSYTGATPVFYDKTLPLTPKTKAVIVVHIYGIPENMDEWMRIAKLNNLFLIEDCCESHGAEWNGKRVGSFGDVGCFSFQSSKIVSSEEGGMITTNSKHLYDKMQIMKSTANDGEYYHSILAFNYRMPETIAEMARQSFSHIKENLSKREHAWNVYDSFLKDYGHKWVKGQVAWVYPIFADVPFGRRFFQCMSSQPMYGGRKDISKNGRILPISVDMTDAEIRFIARKVATYIKKHESKRTNKFSKDTVGRSNQGATGE